MGIVIGTKGRNINQIKERTHTNITTCNGYKSGKEYGFIVTGAEKNVEEAQLAIRGYVVSIRQCSIHSCLFIPIFTYQVLNFGEEGQGRN